ncbi:Fe-S cluster assembly protein SufB [Candidatus Saccharibacteria bacterium]|nr:Fe-S cluster assembly protein SufB [Candidatus Saccharibacteria bacterium]
MTGLSEKLVREISARKNEPEWMLKLRLSCLEIFRTLKDPTFGPDLSGLELNKILMYVPPESNLKTRWEDVPSNILETFEELGIPESERAGLAGVEAQYDSEVVYHRLQEEAKKQGVIYCTIENAILEYPDLIRKYFLNLVKPEEHKFLALHGAVFSGGSFVYVPEGVDVEIPLQAYFRFNAPAAGQFEHTVIVLEKNARLHFIEGCSAPKYNQANLHAGCVEIYVGEGAKMRYSTVENWSRNMYNLNTKRATVAKGGRMEWVSGSFGSKVSMLYPSTILAGEGATADFLGVSMAASDQDLDTGAKMIHLAKNTSSKVVSKSIAKSGGNSTFRTDIVISEQAENSKAYASCDSLILDSRSSSKAVPALDVKNGSSDAGHEATVGRISKSVLEYLMARGLSEDEATSLVVAGYVDQVSKELPFEYAVEMNNLVALEMEGGL